MAGGNDPMKRLMRLRASQHLRDLCAETEFNRAQLIQPFFVVEGLAREEPIPGLRGNVRHNIPSALKMIEQDLATGVTHFLLFPVPAEKQESGFSHDATQQTISQIRKQFGNSVCLWIDTCLCSYTTHGHCAVLDESHIKLDETGFKLTPIMSYSTKFASNFYGPFRNAADSAPQFGDRRGYQLDVRNRSGAIAASVRCAEEGADILMVKPGMTSLDLIRPIHEVTGLQ